MEYLLGRVDGHGLGMRISGIIDGVIDDRQIAGTWLRLEDSRSEKVRPRSPRGMWTFARQDKVVRDNNSINAVIE